MSNATFKITVVTCTHNPRQDYLRSVLGALANQTLQKSDWEFLLIDNASERPLSGCLDLSWHPFAKHVTESQLGLTPARLRGIAEARGEVLVFVDDDNVLSEGFLEEALRIGNTFPFLGVWGGGSILPEFETPPPSWAEPYYPYLALRDEKTVSWSNSASPLPLGAGLCVRSYVANRYREEVVISPTRMRFDRRGRSLDGGGDLDLVLTARRFEMGWGIFPTLKLLHLMPSGRTKKEYLLRLVESASFSMVVWSYTNGLTPPFQQGTLKKLVRTILILKNQGWIHVRFFAAQQHGIARGWKHLRSMAASGS